MPNHPNTVKTFYCIVKYTRKYQMRSRTRRIYSISVLKRYIRYFNRAPADVRNKVFRFHIAIKNAALDEITARKVISLELR